MWILPIHFSQHDVDRPDERHHVRHQVASDELPQRLQVAERRRPHAQAIRADRLAVGDNEEAELPFRGLDGMIGFARRRLDQAGWASNSKYPLLASLRASAQLVSYEIAVTMTLVSLVITAGTLSMVGIVEAQRDFSFSLGPFESRGLWFVFAQPVAFVLVLIGGLAETNRSPFDLPEAEQELTGGFHTEYSGMRFALFFLAEYANVIVVSCVLTTLFFGGWLRPFPNVSWLGFLNIMPGWIWFLGKTFVFLYIFVWIRATWPRYRYDQLMRLGWKVLIPIAIGNIVVTGVFKVLL